MTSDITRPTGNSISREVTDFSAGLERYLSELGLPPQNVLVPIAERGRVISNLPEITQQLSTEILADSLYLSKFVAACGAGLFDAALNFLWDETVKSLRNKVARFDLTYFYDATLTNTNRRAKFSTAEQLCELDDWELVKGCQQTGILSDIGFRHLDYIRNMRNWASAAHPNQNSITGFQLVSWLETCIKEVIAFEPTGPVIHVKQLLFNLRNEILSAGDVSPIKANIAILPTELLTSLLRTIYGMFVDPTSSADLKNNIRLIAESTWNCALREVRQELGIKYASYAANGDLARKEAAKEFLVLVNGLTFLPQDTLVLELSDAVSNLYHAHIGLNNFHTEPSHAHAVLKYVPDTGEIPESNRYDYVKTVFLCTIGNGYGVSNMAYADYQTMIASVVIHPVGALFSASLARPTFSII